MRRFINNLVGIIALITIIISILLIFAWLFDSAPKNLLFV